MGFAVALTRQEFLKGAISDGQYELSLISNSIMRLARESAVVTEQQNNAVQQYLENNKDEDGSFSEVAIDYVNSSGFGNYFKKKLQEIQLKEQFLETRKKQLEVKINGWNAEFDSFKNVVDKDIKTQFGYFK